MHYVDFRYKLHVALVFKFYRAADASAKYKDRIALAQIKREQILELEKQRREEAWERSQRNAERALEQKLVRNELRSAAAGSLRKSTGGMYRSNSTPNVSITARRNQKPSNPGPLTANTMTRNRPSSYCAQPNSRMVNRRSTFDSASSGSRPGIYYKGASTGNIGPKGFQAISNNRTSMRSPNPSAYVKSPRPLSSHEMSSIKTRQTDSSSPGSNHHVPFVKKPLFDPSQIKRKGVIDTRSIRTDPTRSPVELASNTKLESRPVVSTPRTMVPRRTSTSNRKIESSHDQLGARRRDSLNDSKGDLKNSISNLQNQNTELSEEEAYRIKLMMKRKEAKEREQADKERRLKEEAEEEERRRIRLEEERKIQEEKRIEAERLAEEERKLEAERKLEEAKRLEEERKLEEQRKLEREQKLEEERMIEAERKLKQEIEAKEKKLIEQLTGSCNAGNSKGTTADKSGGSVPATEPATFDEAQRLLQQKEEEERAARKAHMQNIMARVRAANSAAGKSSPRPSESLDSTSPSPSIKDSCQSENEKKKSTQASSLVESEGTDSPKSDHHEVSDDVFDAPKEHDVSKDTVVVSERILSESEDEHVV